MEKKTKKFAPKSKPKYNSKFQDSDEFDDTENSDPSFKPPSRKKGKGGRGKDKQERKYFTESQKEQLEKEFQYNRYLEPNEISDLAEKFDASDYQVSLWFKNRRQKSNKTKDEKPKKVKNEEKLKKKYLKNSSSEDIQSLEVSVNVKRLTYKEILNHTKSARNPFREVQNR